nr:hypothetical protein CFP56_01431 [Quercus suber]POE48109.1 hypothetical protein CFP56_01437 [Quercus suber]
MTPIDYLSLAPATRMKRATLLLCLYRRAPIGAEPSPRQRDSPLDLFPGRSEPDGMIETFLLPCLIHADGRPQDGSAIVALQYSPAQWRLLENHRRIRGAAGPNRVSDPYARFPVVTWGHYHPHTTKAQRLQGHHGDLESQLSRSPLHSSELQSGTVVSSPGDLLPRHPQIPLATLSESINTFDRTLDLCPGHSVLDRVHPHRGLPGAFPLSRLRMGQRDLFHPRRRHAAHLPAFRSHVRGPHPG